jgi:hypothetical protein
VREDPAGARAGGEVMLTGIVTGANRGELLLNAMALAVAYFETNDVRVTLGAESIDEVTYSQGGEYLRPRFTAEFEAVTT